MPPKNEAAVTVIGGGIVGICCALSLLEKGASVRLVERDEPGQGASFGNAGVISPWSCVPNSLPGIWKDVPRWLLDPEGPVAVRTRYLLQAMPWALKFLEAGRRDRIPAIADAMAALSGPSVELYRQHLAGSGHEHLLRDCYYVHAYRQAARANFDDIAWQLRLDHGAPVEIVDGDQLREIEPDLSPDFQAAIIIKDQARALSPGRLGGVLADRVRSLGGEILRASVASLAPREGGGWRLQSDGGEIDAQHVVVAAGAWSARLLEPLGLNLPLEPERGYHMVFREPGVSLRHSIMAVDAMFVASSMESGLRSAGTAEFAGLEALPDYRRARVFKRLTKRLVPGLNTEDGEEWMGIRPTFPDSLPCLGEVPGRPGLLLAFGHAHCGLMMAPMTGRVIADLVTGQSDLDLAPYSVDRFAGAKT
jgi:D-amino-acid dehydrogenase